MKKIIIMAMVITWFSGSVAFAENVALKWDPSSSGDVAGYRIYLKSGDQYLKLGADIPGKTTTTATVTVPQVEGLEQYTIVARAYDLAGNESSDSNEATKDGVVQVWKDVTSPAPPSIVQVLERIARAVEDIANTLSRK